MKRLPLALLLGALSAAPATPASAQDPAPGAVQEEAVRVFLDCNRQGCDFDYFRREIAFVNYVRERQDAQVHVLVTTQTTGGGGTEYTLSFIGQKQFQGVNDTLRYVAQQTNSPDDTRRGLAGALKLGLVPYVADSPLASRIRISYEAPRAEATTAARARDPWNLWTFRAGMRGFFNGEKTYRTSNLNGSFSASRVTEEWKTRLSLSTGRSEQFFDLGNGRTVTNEQRNHGFNGLLVKSLGEHLSAGGTASLFSSTFSNQELAFRVAPAVEYNLFPYSESTRRQLTAQYSVGAVAYDYYEETIFGKLEETRLDQTLRLSLDTRQRWGSTSLGVEGAHYLNDFSKRRLSVNGNADLRLIKGLSLNGFVSAARINDQIFLRKGNATPEQILLRQRQLATSYRYFGSIGINYTFGSIFNNVVNPRFGGGEGRGFVIFD